jgi:hypothetical protein
VGPAEGPPHRCLAIGDFVGAGTAGGVPGGAVVARRRSGLRVHVLVLFGFVGCWSPASFSPSQWLLLRVNNLLRSTQRTEEVHIAGQVQDWEPRPFDPVPQQGAQRHSRAG